MPGDVEQSRHRLRIRPRLDDVHDLTLRIELQRLRITFVALRVEREANVFGAELLMPEASVREAWAAFPDAARLAEGFGVSSLAAQWRLYSFDLAERPS